MPRAFTRLKVRSKPHAAVGGTCPEPSVDGSFEASITLMNVERAPSLQPTEGPQHASLTSRGRWRQVKYEEGLSPVCLRRGKVSSSDLISTSD